MGEGMEKSYTINLLNQFAKFEDGGWKLFVFERIRSLEEESKQLQEKLVEEDILRTEVKQLKTYVDVLERQVSLASKIISTMNEEFPVYTKKKEESE